MNNFRFPFSLFKDLNGTKVGSFPFVWEGLGDIWGWFFGGFLKGFLKVSLEKKFSVLKVSI
jgi:hypothetical protein